MAGCGVFSDVYRSGEVGTVVWFVCLGAILVWQLASYLIARGLKQSTLREGGAPVVEAAEKVLDAAPLEEDRHPSSIDQAPRA